VVLGAPAIAMAINLYAHTSARPAPSGLIDVEATIPLRLLGRPASNGSRLNAKRLLEPLRLAARETLDHIGEVKSGASLSIDCEIPIGAGLGSSAATTVSIILAIARSKQARLTKQETFQIAFGPESFLHGKPSGVDQAATIYGGIIKFTRPDKIIRLSLKTPIRILVCDSGVHRETRKLVGSVVRRSKSKTATFDRHLDNVKEISEKAARAVAKGNMEELGALMNMNHELLREIGVSHPRLEQLTSTARAKGALGAKITGAGGGGCIIVLCRNEKESSSIAKALRRRGGTPYKVSMDIHGASSASDASAQIG